MVTRPELGRSGKRVLEDSPSARLTEFSGPWQPQFSREAPHEGELL